jgi:hypothetical protein
LTKAIRTDDAQYDYQELIVTRILLDEASQIQTSDFKPITGKISL